MSIIEVARIAEVSTATVSRVLNGLPGVRAETVAKVKAAVSKTNYKPQRVHQRRQRMTRTAKLKSGNIAVITLGHSSEWLAVPIMASVIAGIQRGVNSHELRLLLGEMPDPDKLCPLLSDKQLDGGVVFASSELSQEQLTSSFKAMQRHAPIVWCMGTEMAIGVDHVTPDNVSVGRIAFDYLKRQNCRSFGYLTTQPKWPLMRLRGQAFLNSALDAGFEPSAYIWTTQPRVIDAYGPRAKAVDSLEDLVGAFAADPNRPEGLFVGNDLITTEIYPLLAKHGLKVGHNVKIVSCDNEEIRLSSLHPRPASIDIGPEEIGFRAVGRLLNRIDRPNGPPLVIQVAPRLIVPTQS